MIDKNNNIFLKAQRKNKKNVLNNSTNIQTRQRINIFYDN